MDHNETNVTAKATLQRQAYDVERVVVDDIDIYQLSKMIMNMTKVSLRHLGALLIDRDELNFLKALSFDERAIYLHTRMFGTQ